MGGTRAQGQAGPEEDGASQGLIGREAEGERRQAANPSAARGGVARCGQGWSSHHGAAPSSQAAVSSLGDEDQGLRGGESGGSIKAPEHSSQRPRRE